jgi:hypothetical protein
VRVISAGGVALRQTVRLNVRTFMCCVNRKRFRRARLVKKEVTLSAAGLARANRA